jgi:uncharacterized membrane protein HdeD (DUF308 family)
MSDVDGSRRAWRTRTGTKPGRLDFVWDFVGWFSLFPGMTMVVAAFGGRRGPHMRVDETWIWMLVSAMSMLVLVLALAARRVAGVVPRRYPRTMFGLIIFVSIAAPALAWVRLEGQISSAGWLAIAACAAIVVLASVMLIPPRQPVQ